MGWWRILTVVGRQGGPIIDALFDSAARTVTVKVTVTYEDGRTSEVERLVAVRDVEGEGAR